MRFLKLGSTLMSLAVLLALPAWNAHAACGCQTKAAAAPEEALAVQSPTAGTTADAAENIPGSGIPTVKTH